MNITVFGTGYVGLVSGACLAEVGNDVVCVDIDDTKVVQLNQGHIPIYEPGLDELITKNIKAGRLLFTTDFKLGIDHGLFQLVAVGTPPDETGAADIRQVISVAETVATHMNEYKIVVNKSTVPVGTAERVYSHIDKILNERGVDIDFDVVSNPEFLKEGAAIEDFMRPDRIIVGTDNIRTTELLKILYAPFNRSHDRVIAMDTRSAELTKYAANAILATKISFMNELSNIAERTGADIEKVRVGIGSDPRIGYHFIYPGVGYGGSCFPKDLRALDRIAHSVGYDAVLLKSVEAVNAHQKQILFEMLESHFSGEMKGKVIAVWGLAFKPNTDDMREASSVVLMEALWKNGTIVRAYDPKAMNEAHRIYGHRDDLVLCERPEDALDGADALVVLTEWNVFRSPDFNVIKMKLKNPVVFDGRNLYSPPQMKSMGFTYYSIGRAPVHS